MIEASWITSFAPNISKSHLLKKRHFALEWRFSFINNIN